MKSLGHRLDDLEARIVLLDKQNPLPTQRELLLFYWEKIKPVIKIFIKKNFIKRKKL